MEHQFGFRKSRSAPLQLLYCLKSWLDNMEKGNTTHILYLDLKKAFDKVSHMKLMQKLLNLGFAFDLVQWIADFLDDRIQRVVIANKFSGWCNVTSRVPQGSVLGPILFLIYVNDMADNISSSLIQYADDTKLFRTILSPADCTALQEDLNRLFTWAKEWNMEFNLDKCCVFSLGGKTNKNYDHDYIMSQNNTISVMKTVSQVKDLGVIIDQKLSFEEHINGKVTQAFKMLGILRRAFKFLTIESFPPLYKSLVRSHLEYAHAIWHPRLVGLEKKLEAVQRRATKLVSSIRLLEYPDRLRVLNLPTLKYRRIRGDMIELFKLYKGYYNIDVTFFCKPKIDTGKNLRRQSHHIMVEFIKNSKAKHFLSRRNVFIWNGLPEWLIASTTINQFKDRLDNFWSNQPVVYRFGETIDPKLYNRDLVDAS